MHRRADPHVLLAEKHGFAHSQTYLRVLEFLMTPEQAALVNLLPATPDQLAQAARLDQKLVKNHLDTLHTKGVIVPKDYKSSDIFVFCKYAERLWEVSESLIGISAYSEEETRELFRLWDEWKKTDYADMTAARWRSLKASGIQALRIVPSFSSISHITHVLPHENVREMVKVQPLISVVSCSCRRHKSMMNTPCRKTAGDANCLQFAKSAEYSLSRGHGRLISVDEAIAILDQNEKDGLVHQWMNHTKVEASPPYALCSCCRCCCTIWHHGETRQVPNDAMFAKSRYEAHVDASECSSCGRCVDRCQFDAIEIKPEVGNAGATAEVDPDKCLGCGVCTVECPTEALTMRLVRPPEHIPASTISHSQG